MNAHAPTADAPEGVRFRGDGYIAEAGWFGPGNRPRFGWLYRPDRPAPNGVGVVIVPPFGREDICAHRTLRHLAEDASRAGFVAVRFDLDGTGDSAGDDTDPARIQAWQSSIHDACDLARHAGASQLVLVGVRLGATLAMLMASERQDITALVAFNAVVSGRAYLRELRAFQAAMNLPPPPQSIAPETGQETSGFLFTEETCAALKTIDLTTLESPPAAVACVLERDDMPERKGWPEHLWSLGIDVAVHRIPGYVAMTNDPHAGRIAQAFIDACLRCALDLPNTNKSEPLPPDPQPLRSCIGQVVDGVSITERVVAPDGGMFGILTSPDNGHAGRGVLMLNAGAIRHIGSNRIDVPLARQLAASGLQVLRTDLPGIGDSPAHNGEPENVVYGPHCLEDVNRMVTWLHANGTRELLAGGMCSGAYHALRAAIAGQAVDGAYLVNCGVFGPEVKFDPEANSLFGDITHYNQAMKTKQAWRRLLTGKVAFKAIVRVAAWHFGHQSKHLGREIARRLRIPLRDDLGGDLLNLARRGGRVHFLFSATEPGRTLLSAEAGSVVPRLCASGQFSIQILEGADHTFTQRWTQTLLRNALKTILAPQARDSK